MVLNALAYEAHRRFGTFALSDHQLETLLAEVAGFFDRDTIMYNLYAPALNLQGDRDVGPIQFPGGITLRPITDEEFTRIYGGNPLLHGSTMSLHAPVFVFISDIQLPKLIGSFDQMRENSFTKVTEGLDRAIMALETFKDAGAVSYDGVRIFPAHFAMGAAFGSQQRFASDRVPLGRYDLTAQAVPLIEAHAKHFENIHPTLEMASLHLLDGSRRNKPRDAIIDAVIGLESILLSGADDRRELSYRFSINYATLFPIDERRAAYRTARDLYSLRSSISHGSAERTTLIIADRKMTIPEAAVFARSVLRKIIGMFIDDARSPPFTRPGYWLDKALGLANP
jgi:Apea-like HEPN